MQWLSEQKNFKWGGGGGGGGGGWPKRPVDVEQGKSEYVDGPLLIPVDTQD